MATEPAKPREKASHPHGLERYIRYTLIIFAAILIALVVFFVAEYESLRRAQIIDAHHFEISQLLAHHTPLAPSEASAVVRSWMTFEYLNKIFALPPEYLQQQLQIKSASYPRVTISSFAKSANVDSAAMLDQVDRAIESYTATSTATSATSTATPTQSI